MIGCDSRLDRDGPRAGQAGSAPWRRPSAGARCPAGPGLVTGNCVIHAAAAGGRRGGRDDGADRDTLREEIAAYVARRALAVAGAFTMDGRGGWFVDGIDGDHGDPPLLPLLRRLLAELEFGGRTCGTEPGPTMGSALPCKCANRPGRKSTRQMHGTRTNRAG